MTQPNMPQSIEPDLSEVYAIRPQQEMVIDLYRPVRSSGLAPIVLFVHGGGWSGGARKQFHWHARQLANLGYFTGSASYRLSGVAPYPAAIDDVQAAVRWMKKHAGRFGADPARMGAMGSSAGGHLVAMLATRDTLHDDIADLTGISSRVDCVVDVHGVHDVAQWARSRGSEDSLAPFMQGKIDDPKAYWHDASPLFYVDGKTAPILFTHGKDDPLVHYEQTHLMIERMLQHERPFAFVPTPGSGHGFVYSSANPWTQKIWPDVVAWFARFLNP